MTFKKGNQINLGRKHTEETKRKRSSGMIESWKNRKKGKIKSCYTCKEKIYIVPYRLNQKRFYCCKNCMQQSPYKNQKSSERMKKLNKNKVIREKITRTRIENNKQYNRHPWNYIDGKSKERFYDISNWMIVARKCYKRDKYMCKLCDIKNCKLNAHHKIPYSVSKDNSLKNLITLCTKCHYKVHRRTFDKN